jgi:hypothetical protein
MVWGLLDSMEFFFTKIMGHRTLTVGFLPCSIAHAGNDPGMGRVKAAGVLRSRRRQDRSASDICSRRSISDRDASCSFRTECPREPCRQSWSSPRVSEIIGCPRRRALETPQHGVLWPPRRIMNAVGYSPWTGVAAPHTLLFRTTL